MNTNYSGNELPSLNVLALSAAVPVERLPSLLQRRLALADPTVAPGEVAVLDAAARRQVLTAVRQGLQHYEKEALKSRARTNPAQRNAEQLERFLAAVEAATKGSE
ncbi:MAG: hypothetical protein ACRCT8_01745 [Lacipirellulaceae bacterium]